MPTAELTPERRQQILDLVSDYLQAQDGNIEEHIGAAYALGREGIAAMVDAEVIQSILDDAKLATLLETNFGLITGQASTVQGRIMDLAEKSYFQGRSPNELESDLRKEFGSMSNNFRTIARDQVAKAQYEGRNATYSQLGTEQVEVTCAPDACDECTPYDEMILDVDNDGDRPQYHIQCACMDVPVPVEEREPEATDEELSDAQDESESGDHESDR